MVPILRRALLLSLALILAACADTPPPRTTFPPLVYDYLTPIGLNVASIDTEVRATPDVQVPAPIDPVATLLRMARDRLKADGTSGRAVFAVTEVSLVQRAGGVEGTFGVVLDIYAGGPARAAYAEARVYRRIEGGGDDLRGTVYDLEKQLMDAMNVELEFQIRRSLKAWVAATPGAAVAAPVEQQPLPPPGASPSAAAGPAAAAPPSAPPPAAEAPAYAPPPSGAPAYTPPVYAPRVYTPPAYPPPAYSPPSALPGNEGAQPMLNLAPPAAPVPAVPAPTVPAPGY